MKLKQKLFGFGLAAILNSGCDDEVNHFTFAGNITMINTNYVETTGTTILELENPKTGSTATVYLEESRMPEDLKERIELGRRLWVQNCDSSLRSEENERRHYAIANCTLYK